MATEYTAEQIRSALIQAVRDDAPQETCDGLARLLAIHYPGDLVRLQLAVDIATNYPELVPGETHAHP